MVGKIRNHSKNYLFPGIFPGCPLGPFLDMTIVGRHPLNERRRGIAYFLL
jgi:hypothetical protein